MPALSHLTPSSVVPATHTMQLIQVAFLLFLTVSARADVDAYRKNMALLAQYPCGYPQPRAITAEEVIGKDDFWEKTDRRTLQVSVSTYYFIVKSYILLGNK